MRYNYSLTLLLENLYRACVNAYSMRLAFIVIDNDFRHIIPPKDDKKT